jgi:predicted amidohydrolase
MKAALIVNPVTPDIDANFGSIMEMAHEAADNGAELVLFPEAAITGLINNDIPAHDLPFGQPIPGSMTDILSDLAEERKIYLAIGILERDGDRLFDSAILFAPSGNIELKFRRISPRWHGAKADPAVYCQGNEITKCDTLLGSFAFMICGDLFDEELVRRVSALRPDFLLYPIARCFGKGPCNQERWQREVMPEYAKQIKAIGVTTLMANYLDCGLKDDDSFGGAIVVRGDGTIIASLPIGKAGVLYVDI